MKISSVLLLLAAVTSAVARTEVCCISEFDDSDAEYPAVVAEAVTLGLIPQNEAPYNAGIGCFQKEGVCSAPTEDYNCDIVVLEYFVAFNCTLST